jgi:hypothetical protein
VKGFAARQQALAELDSVHDVLMQEDPANNAVYQFMHGCKNWT